jgi:hypothetical protein
LYTDFSKITSCYEKVAENPNFFIFPPDLLLLAAVCYIVSVEQLQNCCSDLRQICKIAVVSISTFQAGKTMSLRISKWQPAAILDFEIVGSPERLE